MEGRKQIAVIGGDARQAAAGRALARAGYAVCGAEQVALADYILLPLPLDETRTPLAELLRAAKPGALALGGRLSAQAKQIAQEAGVELVDYFAREELTIRNAIPTAEGCLAILLRQRKRTLWGSGVLVTGFGPVGQALGMPGPNIGFKKWGTKFGVTPILLGGYARVCGMDPGEMSPHLEPVLAALRPGSLIVDLASRPGGTDFAAARRLGLTALHALSLPAACAPETAGEFVAQTVCEILREREGSA